jgi:hypothetical protein
MIIESRVSARSALVLSLLLGLLGAACGGDGDGGGDTGDVARTDAEAPTPQQLRDCLRANGFQPQLETDMPSYGVATIETTIEVPGFPAPGGGTIHVFADVAEAEEGFAQLEENAIGDIERHRNTVIDELVTGALSEDGAEEVRARMEACIGPTA